MYTKKQELSVSHKGNEKLGDKISVFSRAVGDTCFDSCEWLGNGCYAQRTERIYKNTRVAGLKNTKISNANKLRAFLLEAKKRGNSVRFHERGDVGKTLPSGKKVIDRRYINDIIKANQSILDDGIEPPAQFLYTHCHSKYVVDLQNIGIVVYASIDNKVQLATAKKAGFKLFAFTTPHKKKTKIKSVGIGGTVTPVCWEQLGTKESCSTCQYCINGIGDIAFLRH